MPFKIFPNVCLNLKSESTKLWKNSGFFSFVNANSVLTNSLSLTFRHSSGILPDVTVSLPYEANICDNLIDCLRTSSIKGYTWYKAYSELSSALKLSPSDIVLKLVMNGSYSTFIPFKKIVEIFDIAFDNTTGGFTSGCSLEYDIVLPAPSLLVKSDNTCYYGFILELSQCASPIQFLPNLIKTIYSSIQNGHNNKFDVKAALAVGTIKYFLPYVLTLSQHDKIPTSTWDQFSSYCKEKIMFNDPHLSPEDPKISKGDVSFIICYEIVTWTSFIDFAYSTVLQFYNFFHSSHIIPQNPSIIGPIVFSTKNLPMGCSVLLTLGFLNFVNFEPKNPVSYEILPKMYQFSSGSFIPLLSSICLNDLEYIPYDKFGVFISNNYFMVDFDDPSISRSLWFCINLCKYYHFSNNIHPLLSVFGYVQLSFTSPLDYSEYDTFASVSMANVHWTNSASFQDILEMLSKLGPTTVQPSSESCKKTLKEWIEPPFDCKSSYPRKNLYSDTYFSHSFSICSLYDLLTCCNGQYVAKALKLFGISDFGYALSINSASLLSMQLDLFQESLNEVKADEIPFLHHACLCTSDPSIIRLLLRRFSPDLPDQSNNTPIFYAIRNPSMSSCEALIAGKANLDWVNDNGITPLISCFQMKDYERAEILLRGGASINKTLTTKSVSALHFCVKTKDLNGIKLLMGFANQTVNAPQSNGSFVTHWCIEYSFVEALKYIPGLNPNLYSVNFPHPLHFILTRDFETSLKDLLLIRDLDLNCFDINSDTPILHAIRMRKEGFVSRISKDERCDLEATGKDGKTPLLLAIEIGSIEIVRNLIRGGALVDMPSSTGITPLYMSIRLKNDSIRDMLLQANASSNMWYSDYQLPIHVADDSLRNRLKEYGADLNLPPLQALVEK